MKTKNWIQLIALVGLMSLGIFSALYKKAKLSECSEEWRGIIIDKDKRKSRGYYIKYKYFVDGKEFTSSESINNGVEVASFGVGDTIDIKISCSEPDVSRYIKLE